MKSFSAFITEAFTQADITKLRQDAGAFTKNIRRIKTPQELATVAQAFRVWQTYVDHLVYRRLMGVTDSPIENESWASKELRAKWWTLVILDNPCIDSVGHRASFVLYSSPGVYGYTPQTAASWDRLYQLFDEKRDSIYAKTSKAVREAFAALDAYLASKGTPTHPDHAAPTLMMIDGVEVSVITSEVQPSHYDPRATLRQLREVLAAIRRHGLGDYLNRLKVDLYTSELNWDRAGDYNAGPVGRIRIFAAKDNTHTIAHEVGHHVHHRLSPERLTAWNTFIKHNAISFTTDDFRRIHQAYLAAFAKHAKESRGYTVVDMWNVLVPQYLTDRTTAAKYRHFMIDYGKKSRQRIILDPFADGRDVEEKWQEFKKEASFPFMMFAPTNYSNKNPDEAFCEVFAEYVIQVHPLADIVRSTFEEVVGLK